MKPKGTLQKENDEKFRKFMQEQQQKESGLYDMLQEYMVENEALRSVSLHACLPVCLHVCIYVCLSLCLLNCLSAKSTCTYTYIISVPASLPASVSSKHAFYSKSARVHICVTALYLMRNA